MKLTSKGSSAFPKFNVIGDMVAGRFISFTEGCAGRFGPENVLLLNGDDGEMTVRTPAVLSQILRDNAQRLTPGQALTITFCGEKPSGKGHPIKLFDVDVSETDPGESSSEIEDGTIPF